MNSVQLVGNLARDPDFRTTQGGISCCRFTVACHRKFKNQQGQYDADFIACVAWRQTADFIHRYFNKGNRIGVTGTLQTRSYDAQDGTKRFVTEVIADSVEFVAPKGQQAGAETDGQDYEAKAYPPQPQQTEMDPYGDDLPFE